MRVRALRPPVFLGSLTRKTVRCAPPRPSQLRCSLKNKKNSPETKCFPSGPNSGRQGRIPFHWAKLHPSELHCTFQIYGAPSWAPLHPNEQHCTLLSYAAPSKAILHSSELRSTLWAKLHPSELSCTLLSYATPYPSELRFTQSELRWSLCLSWALLSYATAFWATLQPSELRCILLSYAVHYWATPHPKWASWHPKNIMSPAITAALILPVM